MTLYLLPLLSLLDDKLSFSGETSAWTERPRNSSVSTHPQHNKRTTNHTTQMIGKSRPGVGTVKLRRTPINTPINNTSQTKLWQHQKIQEKKHSTRWKWTSKLYQMWYTAIQSVLHVEDVKDTPQTGTGNVQSSNNFFINNINCSFSFEQFSTGVATWYFMYI